MARSLLAYRLAFEEAISMGLMSYRDPDGNRRRIPDRAYIERGVRPRWIDEDSFRRRVDAWRASQPSLERVLEDYQRNRKACDRHTQGPEDVLCLGARAVEPQPQNTGRLIELDLVSKEVARFRRDVIASPQSLSGLFGLPKLALREFFLRLIGSLLHRFRSVGCVATSNEDRSPSGLQGPDGEHPRIPQSDPPLNQ